MPLGLVVIKAVGNRCNLACRYCCVSKEGDRYYMPDQTLKQTIKSISVLNPLPIFFWGGGEPLLSGRRFFEKVINLQAKFCRDHNFINSLQTNGILLDNDWIDFFKQYNFQVGVSWDGQVESARITINGRIVSDEVWNKIELCLKKNLNFGIITVVTRQNVQYVSEIARILYSKGIKNLLLKPYIGNLKDLSLDSADYAVAMCKLLNLWSKTKDKNWIIEPFHSFIGVLSGRDHEMACQLTNDCGSFLTIEPNGDITCCDFIARRFNFGNINAVSINDVFKNSTYNHFIEKAKSRPKICYDCEWTYACSGGCLHYRKFDTYFDKWGKYALCESTKIILSYCRELLRIN